MMSKAKLPAAGTVKKVGLLRGAAVLMAVMTAGLGFAGGGKGFSANLQAGFQDGACANCHNFTDTDSLKRKGHEISGRSNADMDVTKVDGCQLCHNADAGYADAWRASPASMNWSGKSAEQTCTMVKQHMDTSRLAAHLKDDPLVKWGIAKMGMDGADWSQRVDAWAAGGFSCD